MTTPTRRDFLGTSAAMTAGLAVGAAQERQPPANERLTVALIGCGGMGRANLHDFMRVPAVQIAALCDVDRNQLRGALEDVRRAGRPTENVRQESDFRRVLDRRDIDAVIVGTPDHWHAYVLIAACAAGKDVYCEKPLSHNIVEGRAMVRAARQHRRVVQIGTQQRSGRHFQDAVRYVQDGRLGDVFLARTWIANNTPTQDDNPPDQDNPPDGVDYEMWLGPAPRRRFNRNRFHGNFRWFWDYGNGLCNDWGVHLNDIVLWAMRVRAPLSVHSTGGKYDMRDNSDTPDTLDIHYQYPNFTHIYTVRRGKYHYSSPDRSHGIEFHGTKGVLTLDRGGWVVTPGNEAMRAAERHGGSEQHFAHVQNFIHCVRNRDARPASEIEDMHRATTTCHLANIAFRTGRRVYWDAERERCYRGYNAQERRFIQEDGDANAYLLREPRRPWTLPS